MRITVCARSLILGALALALAACSRERSPSTGADPASINRLRSDVTFLASDDLEGRGTPSRGLDLAALYLETQLQAADVAPAVSGSYRQGYRVGNYTPAEARVVVRINGRTVNPGDYIFVNAGRDPAKGPIALPSVEVGYGIVAEERNVDDLAGRDLRGKAYYAANPVAPMKQVVAQINLDMVGRPEGNKVEALAHVSRALFDQAVGAGKRHGIEVIADRHPEWRALYLTDTYAFARAEVPCIHFFTSLHADYHQPSDSAGKIHYAEMARIVAPATEMARVYLDGAPRPSFERPKWFVTP
jgi:hypothetical protein